MNKGRCQKSESHANSVPVASKHHQYGNWSFVPSIVAPSIDREKVKSKKNNIKFVFFCFVSTIRNLWKNHENEARNEVSSGFISIKLATPGPHDGCFPSTPLGALPLDPHKGAAP